MRETNGSDLIAVAWNSSNRASWCGDVLFPYMRRFIGLSGLLVTTIRIPTVVIVSMHVLSYSSRMSKTTKVSSHCAQTYRSLSTGCLAELLRYVLLVKQEVSLQCLRNSSSHTKQFVRKLMYAYCLENVLRSRPFGRAHFALQLL